MLTILNVGLVTTTFCHITIRRFRVSYQTLSTLLGCETILSQTYEHNPNTSTTWEVPQQARKVALPNQAIPKPISLEPKPAGQPQCLSRHAELLLPLVIPYLAQEWRPEPEGT